MERAKIVFEFGGARFSTPEELGAILSHGYFREGRAWGAVRSGWAEIMSWEGVSELLQEHCPGPWRITSESWGLLKSVPQAVREGAGAASGQRLWSCHSGFGAARGPIWGACEAWEVERSAKPATKPKAIKKGGQSQARPTKVATAPKGPRRL